MSVEYLYLLPLIFLIIFTLIFLYRKEEKKYLHWVTSCWPLKPTMTLKLSSILNLLGISLLFVSLLDFRGQEEFVEGNVFDQKTIILIDSSASMGSEDVRPNRFEKAILLTKHYIKKAVGQKISIVVFSDSTKRIVPFTKDTNLLIARLESLEKLDLNRGGTALSAAISESVKYFKVDGSKNPLGNILIMTDAEETDSSITLNVPERISVGVVGIGTAKGGTIPLRDRRGNLIGKKQYQGKPVISKLDEKFLKSLGENIENFKYWIAGSYTIPTEEIITFFTTKFQNQVNQGKFRIKPVKAHLVVIPAVVILIVGYLMRSFKAFVSVILLMSLSNSYSQNLRDNSGEPKTPVKTQEILNLEEKFAQGDITKSEQYRLSQEYLKAGFIKESTRLYKEILPDKVNESNKRDYFNYSSGLLETKNIPEALNRAVELNNYLKQNPTQENQQLQKKLNDNILTLLKNNQSQSKSDKSNESDKDKEQQQNQQNQKQSQDNKKNKDQSSNEDKKQESKDKSEKEDSNEESDSKKQDKSERKDDSGDKKNDKKPRSKKEIPALLKQLMSDDNQLQKKLIDVETKERKDRDKKDW